jgi:hypothetical protein
MSQASTPEASTAVRIAAVKQLNWRENLSVADPRRA